MQKQTAINGINGQVKCLQNIRRTAAATLLAVLTANPAFGVSVSDSVFGGDARFGAQVIYKFEDQILGNGYQASASARAEGFILYKSCDLASAKATLALTGPTNSRLHGHVKIGGITVSTYDRSWNGSADFVIETPYGKVVGGEVSFGIGPVGFDLRGKALVGLLVKGNIQVALPPAVQYPVVTASFSPVIEASATGKADLDLGVGSIGIDADLTQLKAGLKGQITYSPRSAGSASVSYRATANFQGPEGKIRAFGTVDLPFLDPYTFSKTLFNYDGYSRSFVLASGQFNL